MTQTPDKIKNLIKSQTKTIKQYIMMLVGLYIGFTVLVTFLHRSNVEVLTGISAGLLLPCIILLVYNILLIKQVQKKLK